MSHATRLTLAALVVLCFATAGWSQEGPRLPAATLSADRQPAQSPQLLAQSGPANQNVQTGLMLSMLGLMLTMLAFLMSMAARAARAKREQQQRDEEEERRRQAERWAREREQREQR